MTVGTLCSISKKNNVKEELRNRVIVTLLFHDRAFCSLTDRDRKKCRSALSLHSASYASRPATERRATDFRGSSPTRPGLDGSQSSARLQKVWAARCCAEVAGSGAIRLRAKESAPLLSTRPAGYQALLRAAESPRALQSTTKYLLLSKSWYSFPAS